MTVQTNAAGEPIRDETGFVIVRGLAGSVAASRVSARIDPAMAVLVLTNTGPLPAEVKIIGKRELVSVPVFEGGEEQGGAVELSREEITDDEELTTIVLRSRSVGGKFGRKIRVDITGLDPAPEPVVFAWVNRPLISANVWAVGGTMTFIPATFTGDIQPGTSVLYTIFTRNDVSDGVADDAFFPTSPETAMLFPDTMEDRQVRIAATALGWNGSAYVLSETIYSGTDLSAAAWSPVVEAVPEDLISLDTSQWALLGSIPIPVGSVNWSKPWWSVSGVSDASIHSMQWTGQPETVEPTEFQIENAVRVGSGSTAYWYPLMTTTAANVPPVGSGSPRTPGGDYSIWLASTGIKALRVRYRLTAAGEWSPFSAPLFVADFVSSPVAPVITAISATSQERNTTGTLQPVNTGGAVATWSLPTISPSVAWITINASTGLITFEPPIGIADGTVYTVTVQADNINGSDDQTFTRTILATVAPPTINVIPDQPIVQGATGSLSLLPFTTGASVTYTIPTPVTGWAIDGSDLEWTEPNTGSYPRTTTVTVRATNSGGTADRAINFPITAALQAPILAGIANQSVATGSTLVITPVNTGGAVVTWGLTEAPAQTWITQNSTTGAVTISPPSDTTVTSVNLTLSATNGAGADSEAFTITIVEASAELWRPHVVRRPSRMGAGQADWPAYFSAGAYQGGDGVQMPICGDRVGDFIVELGDSQGLRASYNGGRTWANPIGTGLRIIFGHAIAIDRTNPNRVVAVGSGQGQEISSGAVLPGIYLSEDKCATFTRVQALSNNNDVVTNNREALKILAQSANGTWYLVTWSEVNLGNARLWKSADGETWSAVQNLPAPIRASDQICSLKFLPGSNTTAYLTCAAGVFKSTNINTTPTWSEITGGITGTPRDIICLSDRRFVSTSGSASTSGVWWTTNDSSWTKCLSNVSLAGMGVGPEFTEGATTYRAIFAAALGSNAGIRPWVQIWNVSGNPATARYTGGAGGSATLPNGTAPPKSLWYQPRFTPYDTSDLHLDRVFGSALQYTFLPSESDPEACCIFGFMVHWRFDGLGDVVWSDAGHGGVMARNMFQSRSTPALLAIAVNDRTFFRTNTTYAGLRAFDHLRANQTFGGSIGRGICILPNSGTASQANRLIGAVAPGYGGGTSRLGWRAGNSTATGNTDATDGWTLTTAPAQTYCLIDYSNQTPTRVYAGSRRSDDAGETWPTNIEHTFIGVSRQNGDHIYGVSGSTVHRSTNGGNSWASWAVTDGGDFSDDQSQYRFAVSPHDGTVAVMVGAGSDLKVVFGASNPQEVMLLAKTFYPSPIRLNLPKWHVTWDPTNARRIAATNVIAGEERILRGMLHASLLSADAWSAGTYANNSVVTHNGGLWEANASTTQTPSDAASQWDRLEACEWEFITRNFPRTARMNRPYYLHDGTLVVPSNFGSFALGPPGITSGTFYHNLPLPFPTDRAP
jgi:hypothetical protein